MKRTFVLLFIIGLIGLIPLQNASALTKVTKDMSYWTFYGGGSIPVGEYNGIPGDPFFIDGTLYTFEGDDIYDNAIHLGFDYGKLVSNHISYSLGFRYINHHLKDTLGNDIFSFYYNPPIELNQYDLGLELQYRFNDLKKADFSPYVGLSVFGGLTTLDYGGIENENRFNVALGLDFGAEYKIMQNQTQNKFMTIVSTNSYNFGASDDRPKYLHLGLGLRMYFND